MNIKKSVIVNNKNTIFLLYFIVVLFTSNPLANDMIFRELSEFLYYGNLIFVVLGFYCILRNEDKEIVLRFALTCLILVTICLINKTSIGALSAFLTLIFGMKYCCNLDFDDDFLSIIANAGIVYIIISVMLCNSYYLNWFSGSRIINPNTICSLIFVFTVFINLIIGYKCSSKLLFLINILSVFLIFKYKSRTCLVAICIFLALPYIIPDRFWQNKRIMVTAIIFAAIGGVLFPLVYINAPQFLVQFVTSVTHKDFYSGREQIWTRLFNALKDPKNFIIGPGSWREAEFGRLIFKKKESLASMHNSYMSMLLNFGISGIIVYINILCSTISKVYISAQIDRRVKIALSGYISFMIIGYGEVLLLHSLTVMLANLMLGMALYYSRVITLEDEIVELINT